MKSFIEEKSSLYCPPTLHTAHQRYILPTNATFCPPMLHTVHQRYLLPTNATYCPPTLNTAHQRYLLPTNATYCPPTLPTAHQCYTLPTNATYCPPTLPTAHQHYILPTRLLTFKSPLPKTLWVFQGNETRNAEFSFFYLPQLYSDCTVRLLPVCPIFSCTLFDKNVTLPELSGNTCEPALLY